MGTEFERHDDAWDAIVVGSGATGGWCCKHLTEAGLRVLLLEAGPNHPVAEDLHELAHRGRGEISELARLAGRVQRVGKMVTAPFRDERHAVQRRCYRFHPILQKYFVDDVDHPYSVTDPTEFNWIRSRAAGGRTTLWARICVRMADSVFHAASADGHGADWPISYLDLAPFYDRIEKSWGVYGHSEGWDDVPDGSFADPPAYTPAEEAFKDAIETHFPERSVSLIRKVPWYEHTELSPKVAPPSTSIGSSIRDAERTGRLTVEYDAVVSRVMLDEAGERATGVEVVDGASGTRRVVSGKAVFLAASTLETTRILLNETSDRWPTGLGNDSGVLGRYLSDHLTGPGLEGSMPGSAAPADRGLIELYTPNWLPYDHSRDFLRGYQVQTMLGIPIGAEERAGWSMNIFGEVLAHAEHRVELDHTNRDVHGLPTIRVHFERTENDERMAAHSLAAMIEMAETAGLDIERVNDAPLAPGTSVHEVGTARMGSDASTSVVDEWNRVHGCPNVRVVDGACWPSSGYQNPTLTMVAIAARACEHHLSTLS